MTNDIDPGTADPTTARATDRTAVAVIGTGAIGTAVARTLLRDGHPVVAWNRSPERAEPVVAAGARLAGSRSEALTAAGLVVVTVTDHDAVLACLADAPALEGRTVVAMGTGTPEGARAAARAVVDRGGRFLASGVQAGPEAVGSDAATFVLSGDAAAYEEHRATLQRLGRTVFLGAAPDGAAAWDLALFGIWYDAQLGLLRALATARAAGLDLTALTATATASLGHVVAGVDATVAEVVGHSYPAGPADLTGHLPVLRSLLELRAGGPLGDGGLDVAVAAAERLVAAGRGGDGLNALVEPVEGPARIG